MGFWEKVTLRINQNFSKHYQRRLHKKTGKQDKTNGLSPCTQSPETHPCDINFVGGAHCCLCFIFCLSARSGGKRLRGSFFLFFFCLSAQNGVPPPPPPSKKFLDLPLKLPILL